MIPPPPSKQSATEGTSLPAASGDNIEVSISAGSAAVEIASGTSSPFKERRRSFDWTTSNSMRNGVLSIIDQTIISATSFLTTIMIGRACGAEELGIYSLAFTIVVLAANLQTAVFTTPYTIFSTRLSHQERRIYAGNVLMHCLFLMALAAILLVVVGYFLPSQSLLRPIILVLAAVTPQLLLREFVRRISFAHLQISSVLLLDVAIAVIQISGLGLLFINGWLSAFNVYLVMGLACTIAGGVALLRMRGIFSFAFDRVIPELKRSWQLGRWIAASKLTVMVQSYAAHWLLAVLASTALTGIYSASMVVLLAANPFVIGIGNILEPRAAQAMSQGGVRHMNQVVWNATLLLGLVMGLYCVLVIISGGSIVAWLYKGSEYANQGPTVAVLALAALVSAWETGAVHGLRILERPDLSFRAGFLSLGITLVLGFLLIRPLGTLGAACSILAGDTAAAIIRWVAYTRLSKRLMD
jgi:O-antigen/teichoic acid export membrane protein